MRSNQKDNQSKEFPIKRSDVRDFVVTICIVGVAIVLSLILIHWTNSSMNIAAVFTLAVLMVARMTDGYGWGIFASVMGVISVNFAFTDPYYKLNFSLSGYPIIFLSLFVTSVITSAATANIKRQANRARVSEQRTRKLYDFSQQLANAHDADRMIDLTLIYLNDLLQRPVLYARDRTSVQQNQERIYGQIQDFISDSIEQSAMSECFENRQSSGSGTLRQPYAAFRYFPIVAEENMLGCVGILWKDIPMDDDLLEHIGMILAQTGVSLERLQLSEERNRAAMTADHEKIRNNLLRTMSHDLRTPLTGMIGASAAIVDNGERLGGAQIRRLAQDINEDAEWLLHMVENLLSVTRVSQGAAIKKTEEAAEEVIEEAVARCKKRYPDAQIRVQLPDEMIFVPMDVTLIVQVLINLIENAIRYANTPVDLSVCREGNNAVFSVRDFGPGIEEGKRSTLFDAAQTPDSRRGGLGIGLTLCRSILTAHGGSIDESNHADGGAQFIFTLPLEEQE